MDDAVGPSQVKDEEYFFEDGNCVFWVEGVLFNLHRTILRRNSTFFHNLFSLPKAADGANGQSNDQPIVCHDPVPTFRAWCCALYAGFNNLQPEDLDKEKVAHIGLMAHKYGCDAMENWAKDTFLTKLEDEEEDFTNECLEYWLRVATQCYWPRNVVAVSESRLLDSISEENPHHLRDVIRIADNVESEGLKARAYYQFLRCHEWSLSPPQRADRAAGGFTFMLANAATIPWFEPLTFLTDSQKLRLHHGYIALSALRDQMRRMPSVDIDCSCTARLRKRWAQEGEKMSLDWFYLDPKEFLQSMRYKLEPWVCDNHEPGVACGLAMFRSQVDGFLDTFDDNLVRFFPKHF
ncbi:hypothetical protein D9756_005036 [Leucocoprinus leucothites]|uniref:BTB domain-containing protein n=1 Tax=Leucocoprinus leucothites TaxID=201217 RepID=A0A8H5LKJ0_9AGAR|nr:hypothetical protein D9756_005036 [Leucoagaricus leucothites]